jgi:hypothetical protein
VFYVLCRTTRSINHYNNPYNQTKITVIPQSTTCSILFKLRPGRLEQQMIAHSSITIPVENELIFLSIGLSGFFFSLEKLTGFSLPFHFDVLTRGINIQVVRNNVTIVMETRGKKKEIPVDNWFYYIKILKRGKK